MNTQKIKEIGTINIESLSVAEGHIEMRVPINIISTELDQKLEELFEDFRTKNPSVKREKITYEPRLIFYFGCDNTEFTLMLIVFDRDNEEVVEYYEDINVTLSEELGKQIKRTTWDKLGETILGI